MQSRNFPARFFRDASVFWSSFGWSRRRPLMLVSSTMHTSRVTFFSSRARPPCTAIDSLPSIAEEKALGRNVSADGAGTSFGPSESKAVGILCCETMDDELEGTEVGLRELLMTCLETPSGDLYAKLVASTTKLYNMSPLRHWSFHSRALANYGVHCLVDQKGAQAVEFLSQAIETITSVERETPVLHLRVMLANALACEGEYFAALCEYERALAVMRDYPVESSLTQYVSGKEFRIPLSRHYVLEDFDRFLGSENVVQDALKQGQKQLASSSEVTEKVRITCAMARLQRRIGEKDASLSLYTSALRMLLDSPDVDTEIRVMHDVGLLLCFEAFDITQGLPYLQAASEMSFDFAVRELEETQRRCATPRQKATSSLVSEGMLRVRRAALILLDTAVCLAENEELGKALGLFEESMFLMTSCGMQKHSAWAQMKYADALANASLVDKAIRAYLEAMETIQSVGRENENLQVACMGLVVPLTMAEVEGRLAHTFQVHVGEYRRACVHFWQAIRRCGVYLNCPFLIGEEKDAFPSEEVDSETLVWMLENYATCCERVGNLKIAEEVLERRVSIEKDLGGSCSSALLRLAELHGTTNTTRAVELYIQLLGLPDDAIEPDVLLQSAHGFANVCCGSGDEDLAAALVTATAVSDDGEAKRFTAPSSDDSAIPDPNAIVVASFKRAASVIMTSHAVDTTRSDGNNEDELRALMTLSRGGFFCQRRGDEAGAEELYRLAVEYTLLRHVTSEEYSRELAIMLANYATVMAHKDVQKAQLLYTKAADTCPTEENVLTAAVSFFVLTANYAGGRACVQRMIDAAADHVALSRLYGKLAWLGVVCWEELTPAVRLECLQHLLLALGLEPNNFCLIVTDSSSNPLEGSVGADLRRHLLRGITLSQDQDTVSLACYVAQTKLPHDGKFVNACYKAALGRFSQSTTLLVNYAKFCADYGAATLARKYYAAAFRYSHKDPRACECYADYLALLGREGRQEQVVAGECLARYQAERGASDSSVLAQAQAYALYGKYMATFLPSPGVPVTFFEEALKRNPTDLRTTALYGSFLWTVCARAVNPKHAPCVREQIAVKVEELYVGGLKHQPQSIPLLTALGALYADIPGRFDDAVRVLEQARKLSPRNVVVHRLLCAAFHDESMKEEERVTVGVNARLQSLLETTQQLYEATVRLEPSDRLTLARYCQFALHGLRNKQLAAELMRRLQELPKA